MFQDNESFQNLYCSEIVSPIVYLACNGWWSRPGWVGFRGAVTYPRVAWPHTSSHLLRQLFPVQLHSLCDSWCLGLTCMPVKLCVTWLTSNQKLIGKGEKAMKHQGLTNQYKSIIYCYYLKGWRAGAFKGVSVVTAWLENKHVMFTMGEVSSTFRRLKNNMQAELSCIILS